MFDLLSRLFVPPDAPPEQAEAEARRAAAAILVEAARSDDDYAEGEKRMIDEILARRFHLDSGSAAALRSEGESAAAAAVDQYRFTAALKEALTVEERAAFLTDIWRVILSDGVRDADESAFMRKLAGLLYVSDRDSALARQEAEGGEDA